jgi:VRR-NUC domain
MAAAEKLDQEFDSLVAALPPRGTKRRGNPETALQKEIVDALRAAGHWVVRVPGQGVLGHGRAGAFLKPSEMAGFPDLLVLLPGGRAVWLEVKTDKGRLNPTQKARIERLRGLGHEAHVVRSTGEALKWTTIP